MPDLRISQLTIEYSSGGYAVRPIDHLNVTMAAGELTLLLGPSGCGKTSLLSCLGGILQPKSGSIRVGDLEVTGLRGHALTEYRRHTVGIVFQSFNLVPSLSALENVTVPLRGAGRSWSKSKVRAEALLNDMALGDRKHHRPGDLSGGQQQRVAIARALALDPPLILADEPTAHLDYVQVEEVIRLVRSLATGHRAVVVATHDHRLVPLADQIIELVPEMARSNLPPEPVELAAGEVLFCQGEWGERIFVVEDGEIEIVGAMDDGTEQIRAIIASGNYFGEMGPLYGIPRTATARARVPSRVVGYTPSDFKHSFGSNSKLPVGRAELDGGSPMTLPPG